jgi:hypothetical protein
MRQVCRLLLAACLLLLPAQALAHAPPEATGIEWSAAAGTPRLIVRSNRGLLVASGSDPAVRLLCNDAYQASLSETVPFHSAPEGLLLASYACGLLRARADLCEFRALPVPFADKTLIDVDSPGGDALYALTLPTNTEWGQIFHSDDGGDHFSPGAKSSTFGTTVVVAPGDASTLYVAQVDLSDPSAPIPQIAVSHDAGQTFTPHPLELAATEFRSFVLGVDPTNAQRVFVRTEAGDSSLAERVLLSEDGGQSWASVLSSVGPLSLTIGSSGRDVWVGGHEGLFHSLDGGQHFQPASTELSFINCLALHEGALYACAYAGEFGVFVSQDDARTFQPFLRFSDVKEPFQCPADSQVATSCLGTFEDWRLEQNQGSEAAAVTPLASSTTGNPRVEAVGCQLSRGSPGSLHPPFVSLFALSLGLVFRAGRRRARLTAPPT